MPLLGDKKVDCSSDDIQGPPIENEEWLAFLRTTMLEVLNGDLESLRQQQFVSIRRHSLYYFAGSFNLSLHLLCPTGGNPCDDYAECER